MSSATASAVETFAANRAVGRVVLEVAARAGITRRLRVSEVGRSEHRRRQSGCDHASVDDSYRM